jgi:hypothetical protein
LTCPDDDDQWFWVGHLAHVIDASCWIRFVIRGWLSVLILCLADEGVIENPTGVGSSGEEKLDDTTTLRPLPEQIPI